MKHGTVNMYTYRGCRCDQCREANRLNSIRWRGNRGPMPNGLHGTVTGYNNWDCRCDACSRAGSRYYRDRYARRKGRL